MVGKIVNHHKAYTSIDVFRGQEKGYFAFGGSSILLLFQPGTVAIDRDIMRNTAWMWKPGYGWVKPSARQ